MTWLARTPIAVVRAHVVMLPRLLAEESLLAVEQLAVGTGAIRPADGRAALAHWQRAAAGAPVARRATGASLAAMGIAVHRVKPPHA